MHQFLEEDSCFYKNFHVIIAIVVKERFLLETVLISMMWEMFHHFQALCNSIVTNWQVPL